MPLLLILKCNTLLAGALLLVGPYAEVWEGRGWVVTPGGAAAIEPLCCSGLASRVRSKSFRRGAVAVRIRERRCLCGLAAMAVVVRGGWSELPPKYATLLGQGWEGAALSAADG